LSPGRSKLLYSSCLFLCVKQYNKGVLLENSYSVKVQAGLPGVAGCRVLVAAAICIHPLYRQPASNSNVHAQLSIDKFCNNFFFVVCKNEGGHELGCRFGVKGRRCWQEGCMRVYVEGGGRTSGGGGHLAMAISLRLSSPLMYSSEFDKICTSRLSAMATHKHPALSSVPFLSPSLSRYLSFMWWLYYIV